MRADLLLDNFQTLAEAPNGVQKLRNMILELATAGRLTRVASSERVEARLREIVRLRLSSYGSEPVSTKRNYEVVKVSNISGDGHFVGYLEKRYFEDEGIDELLVEQGDLLVVKSSGSAERVLSGKAALCGPEQDGKLVATNFIFRLNPDDALVFPAYLWYVLNSPMSKRFVRSVVATFTYPNLKWSTYGEHPIPLPSLAEQRLIVAKVSQLMTLCDELEKQQEKRRQVSIQVNESALNRLTSTTLSEAFSESWQRVKNNFDLLYDRLENVEKVKQAILQLAVQGKLVPQNSKDEQATVLLNAIDNERKGLVAVGERRIPESVEPVRQNEIPWTVPLSWSWRRLADLFLFIDYRGRTPVKQSSGVRLLTAKNVRMGLVLREPEEFVSEKTYHEWMTRGLPREGDILFTTEAPLGNVAVLALNERVALAQRILNLRPFGKMDPDFVCLCMQSRPFQEMLLRHATGMTAIGIKSAKMKLLPFPIPPIEEQKRIVKRVIELLNHCNEIESKIRHTHSAAERLLDAVVGLG